MHLEAVNSTLWKQVAKLHARESAIKKRNEFLDEEIALERVVHEAT